jgi:hypothetical protein
MTLSHKALAATLLCGAIGFVLPSYAADYGSGTVNPSSTAATTENGSPTTANTSSTPAKETKKAVRPRRTAARARVGDEHAIVEALNRKSLEAVQTGQTPDFAAVEPAAKATKVSSKAVVRHRATTKAKKGV